MAGFVAKRLRYLQQRKCKDKEILQNANWIEKKMNQNQNIIPVLRIFDVEKAKAFYLDFLGFQLDWTHQFEENFPLYMQISKDQY